MFVQASPRGAGLEPGKSLYGIYVGSLATALLGNLFVRLAERGDWTAAPVRVVVALLSVLPLVIAVGLFWRLLRSDLDELLQRVVLEGMAFAMVIYLPLAALYVNLRTAGVWTPRLDPPDVLLTPAVLVALGVMLSWRRYR